MNNAKSVETARSALARAAWVRGQVPAYDEDAVIDLLRDIHHLCAVERIDFDRCEFFARIRFNTACEAATGGAA